MNFCEDHWKPDGHSCSKFSQVQKEIKNSIELKSIETQKSKSKKKSKKNPCQLPNCSGYNLVHMGCGECGGNFCMKHRFPEDHDCIRRFNSRFSRLLAVN